MSLSICIVCQNDLAKDKETQKEHFVITRSWTEVCLKIVCCECKDAYFKSGAGVVEQYEEYCRKIGLCVNEQIVKRILADVTKFLYYKIIVFNCK